VGIIENTEIFEDVEQMMQTENHIRAYRETRQARAVAIAGVRGAALWMHVCAGSFLLLSLLLLGAGRLIGP